MSNEIARVEFGQADESIRQSCQPSIELTAGHGDRVRWAFCGGGMHSLCVDINPEMFDALRELVTNQAVVEHYESLRKPRYENGCTGDPVLVPGSFRTERNKQ